MESGPLLTPLMSPQTLHVPNLPRLSCFKQQLQRPDAGGGIVMCALCSQLSALRRYGRLKVDRLCRSGVSIATSNDPPHNQALHLHPTSSVLRHQETQRFRSSHRGFSLAIGLNSFSISSIKEHLHSTSKLSPPAVPRLIQSSIPSSW